MSKHTQGQWKAIALGGSSTVVVDTKPERNDTRIPSYGYRDELGHCIAYPFLDDIGIARRDFVCFSHADAKLIAAAPALLEALESIRQYANDTLSGRADGGPDDRAWQRECVIECRNRARAAIAKVTGEAVPPSI